MGVKGRNPGQDCFLSSQQQPVATKGNKPQAKLISQISENARGMTKRELKKKMPNDPWSLQLYYFET